MGVKPETIQNELSIFRNTGMRQKIYEKNGMTIIEDCYNAGPESTEAALGVLASVKTSGKRIAVLGDMLELGERSEEFHRETGRAALDAGALLLTTGELSAVMGGEHYGSKAALIADLPKRLRRGDVVLVKASHSMAFEEISEALREIKL